MTTTISTNPPHPEPPSDERAVDMSSRYSPAPAFRQPSRCRVAYTISDGQIAGTIAFPNTPLQRFIGAADLEDRLAVAPGRLVLIDLHEHPKTNAGRGAVDHTARAIMRVASVCQSTRGMAASLCLGLKYALCSRYEHNGE